MARFSKETIYKINPEIDEWETDTYKVSRFNQENQGGLYFHRFVDGEHEAGELAWFNDCELDVLIEA